MTEQAPIRPRINSLVASAFVAIASGTPYVYSVYAPQLIKNSNLNLTDAAKLSLALSLGGSIGGFPAGIIIDNLGPGPACFLGSVIGFIAFKTLHNVYVNQLDNVLLISAALAASNFASVISFYSTINCTTANFPHHRGTAGAIPVSTYALAALLYSAISVRFFKGNTAGLLHFFTYFGSVICLIGSFFLVIVDKKKNTRGNEGEPLIRRPSTASFVSVLQERRISIQHRLSLWGIGRTPSYSNLEVRPNIPKNQRSNSDAIYVAVEDVPVFVRLGSPIWNHHIFQKIFSRLYLKFFIILASLQAIGQTYIYSVGYLVVTLENSNPNSSDSVVNEAQALQVSTVALASFLGRLSSGPISDIVSKKFRLQRIWCIFFAALLMTFSQFLITQVNNIDHLTFPSFVTGFSFGFVFGTFPAVIADNFGTSGFSTLWGFLTTGGVFILSQLTSHLSSTIKKHSDEDGVCKLGAGCYQDTFILTQYIALFIASLILFTIYINHRIAKRQAGSNFTA